MKLLSKYKPETKAEKKERMKSEAANKIEKKNQDQNMLNIVKYGLNHVTTLIENKKAKLVVIAHDVDPIELVVFLPALCQKKDAPYCFVKGKARLGTFVNKKTATCVALCNVGKEDQQDLESIIKMCRTQYNSNTEHRKTVGGGIMGIKAQHKIDKYEKVQEAELAKKMQQ